MSMKGMSWTCALALVVTAASTQAQVPGVDLSFFPRVGLYRPLGDLADEGGARIKLNDGRALGASAEVSFFLLPVGLRVNLDYVLPTGSSTNDVASTNEDNTLLMISGDLVLRLAPGISPLQAYLMAGAGTKRYDFDGMPAAFASEQSSFTGHLGAGLSFKFGPLGLGAEVSDYISSFKPEFSSGDRKLQNDVLLMAGLRMGVF